MSSFLITTSFELTNGKLLVCEYTAHYLPRTHWEPEEWNCDSPVYTLAGKEVELWQLPKGLDDIALELYDARQGEYNYRSEPY